MLRRLIRVLAYAVALLVLLVVAGFFALQTTWAKERIRRLAVERAAPYLTGRLEIGRLDGSLLQGVELHDIRLTQPTGVAVEAELITVRYDPMRLWQDGLAFDSIALQDEAKIGILTASVTAGALGAGLLSLNAARTRARP